MKGKPGGKRTGRAPGPEQIPEVAGRAVAFHLAAGRAAGIELASTLERMPFTEAELRRPGFRISWDQYVTLIERMVRVCGSEDRVVKVIATQPKVIRDLKLLASAFVSPMRLFHYAYTVRAPAMFLCLEFGEEVLGPNGLRLSLEILEPYAASPICLKLAARCLEVLPTNLALPAAKVESELGPRRAVYLVTLPESKTLTRRIAQSPLGDGVRALLSTIEGQERAFRRLFEYKRASGGRELDVGRRVAEAIEAWSLTPREAEVLTTLSRGADNKSIATALGVSASTVELHITNLLRKANAGSRTELIAKLLGAA